MSLSFASGEKYVAESTSSNVGELANALAKGLLMGARGNSGVILSQVFRGFSKSITQKETLSAAELATALDLVYELHLLGVHYQLKHHKILDRQKLVLDHQNQQLQLLFSKSITQKETLSAAELATALQGGVETAYKAVMKPQEGTILTVARKAAEWY